MVSFSGKWFPLLETNSADLEVFSAVQGLFIPRYYSKK